MTAGPELENSQGQKQTSLPFRQCRLRPPKADIDAGRLHIGFGPKAVQQTSSLFDHCIGTREQARGYIEAERLPDGYPRIPLSCSLESEKDRVKFQRQQFQKTI